MELETLFFSSYIKAVMLPLLISYSISQEDFLVYTLKNLYQ